MTGLQILKARPTNAIASHAGTLRQYTYKEALRRIDAILGLAVNAGRIMEEKSGFCGG
jgi:hypothetical protein